MNGAVQAYLRWQRRSEGDVRKGGAEEEGALNEGDGKK